MYLLIQHACWVHLYVCTYTTYMPGPREVRKRSGSRGFVVNGYESHFES